MSKVLLVVLDGFGLRVSKDGNAVAKARMPFFSSLWKQYSHMHLKAAGRFVGLPDGFIGNSEVGHLHIGAGRLVKQDLSRIFDSIHNKSFFSNAVLRGVMRKVKKSGTLHVMGLLSDAGVHSHVEHLFAILRMAKQEGVRRVAVHAFLDGRDVRPVSAEKYLRMTENVLKRYGGRVASLSGRFFAMDRDHRWERTREAYRMLVGFTQVKGLSAVSALKESYARGVSDEFVRPVRLTDDVLKDGDSVVFFNFRADRMRQLLHALVLPRFSGFSRRKLRLNVVGMTQYDEYVKIPVIFSQLVLKNTLGEVVSVAGKKQFRLAETEKWAHVTFFFNGLSDGVFRGESRLLVPSPKVRTYDKTPKMSAEKITAVLLKRLGRFDFVLVNYANPDMVGHTGDFRATVQANECVDRCLSKVVPVAIKKGYAVIVTADHGKAEEMLHVGGGPCTSHTLNDVPFILVSKKHKLRKMKFAALYHVAPTVLELMGLKKPKVMVESLIRRVQ